MSKTSYQSKGNELNRLLDGVEVEWTTLEDLTRTSFSGGTPKAGRLDYYENETIPWLQKQEFRFSDILEKDVKITPASGSKANVDHFALTVDFDATAGNDYNLSISRPDEAEDTRERVELAKLNTKLKTTVARIDRLRSDIDAIVAKIDGEEVEA